MFTLTVLTLTALLLFLATSATLYMGVFKAHREGAGWPRKLFSGLAASALSAIFWAGAYGYHYLGW
ncbi:MAG TPA: hypothetical protein ENF48_03675 [Desulfobacteraceae bacterium]|nr:hypothetical protein [Deltaproteobacteria bacterium]MBW2355393.1 hypothetical protein [Deltaproteobacteria bacterium]HDI59450.1 hypothetical protein [Desulfobacteraceae bacterium]